MTIAEEAGLPESWHPIDEPAINPGAQYQKAPPSPNPMGNYFQGSLSPSMQHDAVFVGTMYGSPLVPNISLMPVGPSGVSRSNSSIISIATNSSGPGRPGAPGAPGAPGTPGAPGSPDAMIWKGTWQSFTSYAIDNVVQLTTGTYIAIQASVGINPSSDATVWTLISANSTGGFNQSMAVDSIVMSDDYWISVDSGAYDQALPLAVT